LLLQEFQDNSELLIAEIEGILYEIECCAWWYHLLMGVWITCNKEPAFWLTRLMADLYLFFLSLLVQKVRVVRLHEPHDNCIPLLTFSTTS
jgi:hypothetical protein